jgi:hypothetical protein
MKQSLPWEANSSSASEEIKHLLWNTKIRYCFHKSQPNLNTSNIFVSENSFEIITELQWFWWTSYRLDSLKYVHRRAIIHYCTSQYQLTFKIIQYCSFQCCWIKFDVRALTEIGRFEILPSTSLLEHLFVALIIPILILTEWTLCSEIFLCYSKWNCISHSKIPVRFSWEKYTLYYSMHTSNLAPKS